MSIKSVIQQLKFKNEFALARRVSLVLAAKPYVWDPYDDPESSIPFTAKDSKIIDEMEKLAKNVKSTFKFSLFEADEIEDLVIDKSLKYAFFDSEGEEDVVKISFLAKAKGGDESEVTISYSPRLKVFHLYFEEFYAEKDREGGVYSKEWRKLPTIPVLKKLFKDVARINEVTWK